MVYTKSQKKKMRRIQVLIGSFVLLGVGATYAFVNAQSTEIDTSDDESGYIDQGNVRDLRAFVSGDSEPPSMTLTIEPKGMVSPGRDATIVMTPENFGDVNRFHTNWCVDSIPVTHLASGSTDELIKNDDGRLILQNEYGTINTPPEGYATCRSEVLAEISGFEYLGGVRGTIGDEDTKPYPASPNLPRMLELREDVADAYPPIASDDGWYYFQRQPNVDEDEDGLDDEWEIRYFAGRIRPIGQRGPDAEDVPLQEKIYPTDRESILVAVKPEDDPDQDGWEWDYNYDEMDLYFAGQDGVTRAADPFSAAWQLGVPYVLIPDLRLTEDLRRGSGNGALALGEWDGNDNITGFTNLEEFTFGTDPLAADTDDDDIQDEIDVAGLGQSAVTLPLTKKAGESYDIEVHTFTMNTQWRTARIDSVEQPPPIAPLGSTELLNQAYHDLHARKWVRVDYQEEIEMTQSKGFEVELDVDPKIVTTQTTGRLGQERIKVNAVPVLANVDESTLEFSWFLNGTYQEEDSGKGKRFFFFNVDDPKEPSGQIVNACEDHTVTINLIEPNTENTASEIVQIPVSPPVEFTKEVIGHVNRSVNGVDPVQYDSESDNIDIRKGARTGDIVRFTSHVLGIADSESAANRSSDRGEKACAEKGITKDKLTYKWSFDGRVQREQTGSDPENVSAEFEILDEGLAESGDLGSDLEEAAKTGHIVTLEVFGPNGEMLTAVDERISAVGPGVDLSIRSETLEVNSKAAGEVLGISEGIDYIIENDEQVVITAVPEFFAPGEEVHMTAEHNGLEISEDDLGSDGRTLTITTGEAGTVEVISITAESETGEIGGEDLHIRVVTAEELRSVLERRSMIGALIEFIPDFLKDSFRIAIGAGVLAAVLLLVLIGMGPQRAGQTNIARQRQRQRR